MKSSHKEEGRNLLVNSNMKSATTPASSSNCHSTDSFQQHPNSRRCISSVKKCLPRESLSDEEPKHRQYRVRQGDLLQLARQGEFDVIVHGCNCFCAMGAGIAYQIQTQFPEAYNADCNTKKGDRSKLGTYSSATIVMSKVDTENQQEHHTVTVINAYTQYHWKGKDDLAEYDAIRSVFAKIKKDFAGQRIGYPKIGAGLAGGNWDRISNIIEQELEGEDHVLVIYDKSNTL